MSGERVLVVIPSDVVARVVSLILRDEGYEVDTVDREARREGRLPKPPEGGTWRALVVDVGAFTPERMAALWALQEDGARRMAIVGLAPAGVVSEEDRARLAELVQQPFDCEDLVAAVGRAVGRTAPRGPS